MSKQTILGMAVCILALAACSSSDECSVNTDCDDGDLCTEDRCRQGYCSHLTTPWCCHAQRGCLEEDRPLCHLDSNTCVECIDDQDCPSRCHPDKHMCVECVEDSDCLSGAVCDPIQFLCEAEWIPPGEACTQDDQCDSGWCMDEQTYLYPGGHCGLTCTNHPECNGGLCIDVFGGDKTCLARCTTDEDCRPEYLCIAFAPGAAGCFPHCTEDAHCPVIGTCNEWLGVCGLPVQGSDGGAPCQTDQDCKGICVREENNGVPGGMCISLCGFGRPACPGADDRCVMLWSPFLLGQLVCLPAYGAPVTCREGYVQLLAFDFVEQVPLGVCQPACRDDDCQNGDCNLFTGLCGDTSDGVGQPGSPCGVHENCQGLCMDFWSNGYCTSPCDPGDSVCPAGTTCTDFGIHKFCGKDCQADDDCRATEGYICHPQFKVCVQP